MISNAVSGFKDFIGGSIQAAADLEQSIGGVESVFKDNAATIFEWGKTAWQQAGLSENAFNQLASSTGAFLKNFGYDADTVTGTTIELTQRAADMAAMFGGPVEDAMAAIQAGLRGQQDPLERYGVSLTAARVEAHALAMTGKEVAKELTDQEKMTARLDLIMKQTADSAGQFAREQDTAAGKAAIQAAAMQNLSAELGEKLLPVQVKITEAKLAFVRVLSEHVIPVVGQAASWLGDKLGPAYEAVTGFVSDAAKVVRDFVGDVQWAVENGTGFSEKLAPQFAGLSEAIAGVAIFIRENLIPAFQEMAQRVQPVADAIGEFISSEKESLLKALGVVIGVVLVGAFAALAVAAGSAAIGVIAATAPLIAIGAVIAALAFGIVKLVEHWDDITAKFPILGQAADVVTGLIGTLSDFVTSRLIPALAEAVEKFRNDVFPVLERFGDLIELIVEHYIEAWLRGMKVFLDFTTGIMDELWAVIKSTFDLIVQIVETAIELVRDVISVTMALIRGDWEGAWDGIKTLFSNLWENMQELLDIALKNIETRIALAWAVISEGTQAAWDLVHDIISGVWDKIGGLVGDALTGLGDAISDAWSSIRDTTMDIVTGIGSWLREHWQQIVTGILAILFPPGAGLFLIITNWDEIKGAVTRIVGDMAWWIADRFDTLRLELLGAGARIRDALVESFTQAKDWVGRAFGGLADVIRQPINTAIGFINNLIGAWNNLEFGFPGVSVKGVQLIPSVSAGTPNLPYIPYLAEGGIVTRPTLAMIGEAGREAVIPLDRAGGIGGNHYHFHFPHYVGDQQELAESMKRVLMQFTRTGVMPSSVML